MRSQEPYETAVPKLTELVAVCRNPALRPFVTERKVYFWPIEYKLEVLAPIGSAYQEKSCECPAFR